MRKKELLKIYHLRFTDICDYYVKAKNDEEALAINVPGAEHRASIDIISKQLPQKARGK